MRAVEISSLLVDATPTNNPEAQAKVQRFAKALENRRLGMFCAPDHQGYREIRFEEEDRDKVVALIDEHCLRICA